MLLAAVAVTAIVIAVIQWRKIQKQTKLQGILFELEETTHQLHFDFQRILKDSEISFEKKQQVKEQTISQLKQLAELAMKASEDLVYADCLQKIQTIETTFNQHTALLKYFNGDTSILN